VSVAPGVRRIVAGNAGLMTGPGTNTYDELTPVVYDDLAVERRRWARLTLEAHLIKLARECRASERDGLWRPSHP
jgi:Beta-lactamase associated winged helix domain